MLNYLLYRLGEVLAFCLPFKALYFLAKILSTLQYLFSRTDRITVRENIKALFPGIEARRLRKYTKGVFLHFSLYLANFFKFQRFSLGYIKSHVTVEGLKHIDAALSGGKGLIIVSAHIGNWELGGITLGLMGYPLNAVALPHKHAAVDRFFNRQRESKGMHVIPIPHAVRGCLEAFSRNEIVCLAGDRDFTQGGITVDFFGRPAMIPKGPAVFALRNKVPLVCGFTIQKENEQFLLFFNPAIQFSPSGEYEKDLRSLAKLYVAQIEDCIRKYPDQWAMFRKFWV